MIIIIGTTKASVGQAEGSSRLSRRSSSHLFASLIRSYVKNFNELNMPSFLLKSLLTLSSIRVPDLIAVKSTSTFYREHSSTSSKEHSNDSASIIVNFADGNMIDNSGDINIDPKVQCPNAKALLTSLNDNIAIRDTTSVANENTIGDSGNKHFDPEVQCPPAQISRDVDITTHSNTENVSVDATMHKNSIEELLKQPYMWWKKVDVDYSIKRATFLSITPFNLWLCDDPLINEQFPLEIIGLENPVKGERKRDSSHLQKIRKEKPISNKKIV
jgi:hypothetical protein